MKIKLTPIPLKKQLKNKYIVEVEFMHGDADHKTFEKVVCKKESDFIHLMSKIDEGIKKFQYSGVWNSEYIPWWEELFGEDFIPYDITCEGQKTQVRGAEGFYYDENGTKFSAALEE